MLAPTGLRSYRLIDHVPERPTDLDTNPLTRDHSVYGLSQWETVLHRNVVSHWRSPYPE